MLVWSCWLLMFSVVPLLSGRNVSMLLNFGLVTVNMNTRGRSRHGTGWDNTNGEKARDAERDDMCVISGFEL